MKLSADNDKLHLPPNNGFRDPFSLKLNLMGSLGGMAGMSPVETCSDIQRESSTILNLANANDLHNSTKSSVREEDARFGGRMKREEHCCQARLCPWGCLR